MRQLVMIAALVCGLSAALPTATPKTPELRPYAEAAVRAVDQAREKATLEQDAATLTRIYAHDYVVTDYHGQVSGKAERLAAVRSGHLHFVALSMEDIRVRLFESVAVLTSTDVMQESAVTPAQRARFLRVYVFRDGRWQMVASQATLVSRPDRKQPA
jgi:ketosteroid isomerase-like protein